MDKPKTKSNQTVQTYVSCPASPGSLSMGLNFLFVFWVLAGLYVQFNANLILIQCKSNSNSGLILF